MGRHIDRTDLGRRWGATDVVAERGADGIAKVLDLTGGRPRARRGGGRRPPTCRPHGRRSRQARRHRSAGSASRRYEEAPVGFASLLRHDSALAGGPGPVRAYLEELLPEVLDGHLEPGRVFDRTMSLDDIPAGYQAMDDRESLKVLVPP